MGKVFCKSTCRHRKNWEYQVFHPIDERERNEKSNCTETLFKMRRRSGSCLWKSKCYVSFGVSQINVLLLLLSLFGDILMSCGNLRGTAQTS